MLRRENWISRCSDADKILEKDQNAVCNCYYLTVFHMRGKRTIIWRDYNFKLHVLYDFCALEVLLPYRGFMLNKLNIHRITMIRKRNHATRQLFGFPITVPRHTALRQEKENKACRQRKLGHRRRFEPLEARVGYSVRNCSFQFIEQYRSCMPPVVDKIENYFWTHLQ